MEASPNISQNRYSIFADCLVQDTNQTNTEQTNGPNSQTKIPQKPTSVKPPPIYLHGKLNHTKLLEALKTSYNNRCYIKFVSKKLKIMFHNITDYSDFKNVCRKQNIQFHTFTVSTKKILTVILKGIIKISDKVIINNPRTKSTKTTRSCLHTPNTRFTGSPLHQVPH